MRFVAWARVVRWEWCFLCFVVWSLVFESEIFGKRFEGTLGRSLCGGQHSRPLRIG